MLRFLSDENFDNRIVRAMLDQEPALDIVRAREVGLAATDDRDLLEWAASERRVFLTHDVNTVPEYAFERLRTGRALAGVVLVRKTAEPARIIEDLVTIAVIGTDEDVTDKVLNVPFRS